MTQRYEAAREDLQQAHAGRTMAAASAVWFVRGEEATGEKMCELVQDAREQVTVDLPYLLPFDESVFLPALRDATSRGRRVRVLVSLDLDVDATEALWAPLLQNGVEIRCVPLQLRRVLTDFEQGIVVAPREDQEEIVAIWNPVREVVQMLGPSYDGLWETAEPLVDEAGGANRSRTGDTMPRGRR